MTIVLRWFRAALLAAVVVLAPGASIAAAHGSATPPPDTTADRPVATNDLLPQNNDVTNCIGTAEPANCGSDARADGHTYLVLGVLVIGLGFIMWRISRAVRARDEVNQPPSEDRTTVSR